MPAWRLAWMGSATAPVGRGTTVTEKIDSPPWELKNKELEVSSSFSRTPSIGWLREDLVLLPLKNEGDTRVTPRSRCSEVNP